MSVLQPEPALSISTNQCKKQFLISEINEMKQTKKIYLDILHQLKFILKETSSIINPSQTSMRSVPQKRIQQPHQQSDQMSLNATSPQFNNKNGQNYDTQRQAQKLKKQIQQFTSKLQQKIRDYCCSQISQNIVKYLEIQNEEHQFHHKVIQSFSEFIKNHQKMISQRQKQLQKIQDLKYFNSQVVNQENNNNKSIKSSHYSVQKDRQTTEKTISSFDFNQRLLEMAKKQITFLKLKKRKLQIEIEQKKKLKANQKIIQHGQKSQNLKKITKIYDPIHQSTTGGMSEQANLKKLPGLKQNSPLKENFLKNKTNKNDISAFQKIVMVYQKDKFINKLLQQKIANLTKKLQSQKYQNAVLKEKTNQLDKEIQKLEWHKVCDSTFVGVNNKKIDKMMDLSILDRTDLMPCDQASVEYSQMSINQSMIKRY